ncbi:MAG: hypothetical protein AAF289_14475 [Cyanobacteria bacterium P01_A01_bin.135]
MWFAASFTIAVCAAFAYAWFEPVSEELAILCVGIALVCSLVTLLAAPWPVLLTLAIALIATRWVNRASLFS